MGKAKLLAGYAKQSFQFYLKRRKGDYPDHIDTIVVDLDYTTLNTLTAYRALEKLLGPEEAKRQYTIQKERVKSGKANFADVKKWGSEIQAQKGWRKKDWEDLADEIYREGRVNYNLISALKAIKEKRPNIKIILTTGTSSVLGERLVEILEQRHGVKIDQVVGSEQIYDEKGKVTGLRRLVGEAHPTIPATEKIPAIREVFTARGWTFNPKTTMAIADADSILLRESGIGILIPVGRSEDPQGYISQKFRLRDVESRYAVIRQEFLEAIATNPREAIRLAQTKVKDSRGKSDALTRRIIQERKAHLLKEKRKRLLRI